MQPSGPSGEEEEEETDDVGEEVLVPASFFWLPFCVPILYFSILDRLFCCSFFNVEGWYKIGTAKTHLYRIFFSVYLSKTWELKFEISFS